MSAHDCKAPMACGTCHECQRPQPCPLHPLRQFTAETCPGRPCGTECDHVGWAKFVNEPADDRYERMAADEAAGKVKCDEFCGAAADPKTPEEYRAAYEHWRHHGLYYGCSHGA